MASLLNSCQLFSRTFSTFARCGVGTQPGFSFVEQRRLGLGKTFPVSPEQGRGRRLIADREIGKADTGREADQIQRIRHDRAFVEIVDTPDQPAVRITPGTEVFQVQVADGEQLRGIHQFRTQRRDFFGPAEISRAQEDEGALLHLVVLFLDILLDDVALRGQPGFVFAIILAERHPGPLRFTVPAIAPIGRHPTSGCVDLKHRAGRQPSPNRALVTQHAM